MRIKPSSQIRIAILENGLISSYTAREGLIREFVNQNFEVYILTHTNQFQEKVESLGAKVIHVGSGNCSPVKILKYLHNIYRALKQVQPHACLTFSVRPAIWGNIVARHLQIPVITNVTGTGPLFSNTDFSYKFIRFIYPYALKSTKTVFFQNTDDRDNFIRYGYVSRHKAMLIPGSGVDYEKFHPLTSDENNKKDFTFLFIGRLIKDKGIPELIEATREIKNVNPHIKLKIIGPLWHQNLKSNSISATTIEGWISEGIIEYLGERSDVRNDISSADCIVLPSHREGTSNVLLEASAMQKPCITTDVPGCKEVVEDGITGYLCKAKDSLDLAKKMQKMFNLSDEARMEMGVKARQKMIREFDKKIVIARYLYELENILSPKQKPVLVLPPYFQPAKEFPYASGIHMAG